MNIFDPAFERYQIFDSYACRRNKGTHRAVLRAFHFAKSSAYFLKMDVRAYFNSIDHTILKELLKKIIEDKKALRLFSTVIDSYGSDTGLPIGNLTSQYFANQYLALCDHYAKEVAGTRKYIRYMDDILVFSQDKTFLKELYGTLVSYACGRLKLTLKPAVIASTHSGAPFLGFLVKQNGVYLLRKTKERYKAGLSEIEHNRREGILTEAEAGMRMEAVSSHLYLARSRIFRNKQIEGRLPGLCTARYTRGFPPARE
ncbi:RNA-directed DNA polymerase [Brucepastera parasyntrophica]|uniref:RNA-directed DNA polymerase n=1 Tax=Brucepastera parasyntrophica TaxID=2880008 RepID=UPI00210AF6E0|nr:RNA-directed DNA polymerase [Brucepastera parasyntrophica]